MASVAKGRITDATVRALVEARHDDPFAVLGPHETKDGVVIRALVPGAQRLEVVEEGSGAAVAELEQRHAAGLFEGVLKGRPAWFGYTLRAHNEGGSWELHDPYRFPPVLGEMDDYLIHEGTHRRLWERLGAHAIEHAGVAGVHFAVWAPNAARVSVVGDFNAWDGRRNPMRRRGGVGVWEIFIPGLGEGAVYKFELRAADGSLLPLKADPVGTGAELRPQNASVVRRIDDFAWGDGDWLARRGQAQSVKAPVSILEVHLGSWARGENNRFLTYDELAERLVGRGYAVEALHGGMGQHERDRVMKKARANAERFSKDRFQREILEEVRAMLDAAGFDTHIHACGDAAVRAGLDAFEHVRKVRPDLTPRNTVCHLEFCHPDDVPRFAQLGVTANGTPLWGTDYRGEFHDAYPALVGDERLRRDYCPYGSVMRTGANVTFGADCPGVEVHEIAPLIQIEAAVTRRRPGRPDDRPMGAHEQVSVADALRAYTVNGAKALRLEHVTGSIEVGKRADLVQLGRSPYEVPHHEIHAIPVVRTMLGGRLTHG